ncbi:MAG TPA: DUF4403 family protein [Saprospiraceae bacterium]
MKQPFSPLNDADCSCLQIEVHVEASWIDQILAKQQLSIQVSEQYSLDNLRIDLGEGKVILQADIQEKEGSAVKVTCLPVWDVENQKILLEEIDIKLISKNILLKSAGWFATTFMGAKIDKKIEESVNQLYIQQLNNILEEGISIPIKNGGFASVQVRSIVISEMTFLDHSIKVKAMIDGLWKLKLAVSSE